MIATGGCSRAISVSAAARSWANNTSQSGNAQRYWLHSP